MAAETQLANWQNAVDNRFDFGKASYLEAVPDLAKANATAEQIGTGLNQVSGQQGELAAGLTERVGTFAGLQDRYADSAFGANSADKQGMAIDKAQADVSGQYANLKDQAARELSRKNINPGSGRALALSNQLGISQAAATTGASSKALSDLESVANERQKTAIGFGANLPGQASQAAQVAASTGNYAITAASQPLVNRIAFAGGISNIYGDDASGNADLWRAQNLTPGQAATLAANQQAGEDASDAALWSGIGKIVTSDAGQKAVSAGWDWLTGKVGESIIPESSFW